MGLALAAVVPPVGADELSGADKLRIVWSTQFAWTREGLPLVTVRIGEGQSEFTVSGVGAASAPRVLPDGEGGSEVVGGTSWKVRLEGPSRIVSVRYHVVVGRGTPSEAERLQTEASTWRERGYAPRTFETGTVFGIRGAVIDGRNLLLCVSPKDKEADAEAESKALAARFSVETAVHPEVVERPGGTLVARDEHGVTVRNDSVIWFAPAPSGDAMLQVEPVEKVGGGSDRRAYAGQVYVTVDAKGKLAAVNAVPEDKLLEGLLPAEMGASAPAEALKAQAVAARNELLAKIGTRHLTDPYRLCSSVHCQVYAGAGREDPRTNAAVAATRGEVLVRPDGRLVDAVYSSSCGGHTEDVDKAWGVPADPALRGRLDASPADEKALLAAGFGTVENVAAFLGTLPGKPYCMSIKGGSPFRWTTRVPASTVEEKTGVGAIRDVQVLERGVSGRAIKLRVVGDKGEKVIEHELAIRRALGNLKSSMFTLELSRDGGEKGHVRALQVSGGGHGHGVGMCQSGAMGQAERGRGYREILLHYYRDASVKKLY